MQTTKQLLIFFFLLSALFSQESIAKSPETPCTARDLVHFEGEFEVGVTRFSPMANTDRLVLVMPPTGGTTRIDLSYGKALCESGIASIVVNRWTGDQEYNLELEIHDRIYRRAQRAMDLVLSKAPERNVGILGTSLGASHAAIASMRNVGIKTIFLIVGGAPIASIIANSDQKILAEGKAKRFKIYGFRTLEEYEAALRKVIPFEPLAMASAGGIPQLGMAISHRDNTVPTQFQLALKNAWRPTLILNSNLGHVGTVVKTWLFHENQIVGLIQKTLSQQAVARVQE